jgi:hypothetical protein
LLQSYQIFLFIQQQTLSAELKILVLTPTLDRSDVSGAVNAVRFSKLLRVSATIPTFRQSGDGGKSGEQWDWDKFAGFSNVP